jgi:hypothetical protein
MNSNNIKFLSGLIVGLLVGAATIVFLEMINHNSLYINEISVKSAISAKLLLANSLAFKTLMVPLAWLIGAFMASFIATLIQAENAQQYAIMFAILFATIALFNLRTLHSPGWMWLTVLTLIYPASLFGSRFPLKPEIANSSRT